jgi:hypothetical protein
MIPTRFLIALLVLALRYGTTAWCDDPPKAEAAPDPCLTELTLEKLDNPPQRKTNFVRAEEPLKMPLNVKLIDQKFAATIGIELSNEEGNSGRVGSREVELRRLMNHRRRTEDAELRSLKLIQGRYLLIPNLSPGEERLQNERLSQSLERMLAQIPADREPGKADREFFASAEVEKYVSTLVNGGRNKRTFVLLGATAEEAQQRAQTLLTILDQGFSRPIQLALFKEREAQCQQAEERKQKIAAAELQLKALAEELPKYADFLPDTLPGVRVQQFQADAELAGLKAKIEAYEKLLAKVDRDNPRFQRMSEAKTTAEVDLVSCEARRETIAGIIAKIKLRVELTQKQTTAIGERKFAADQLKSIASRIESIDDDITAFGPVRLTDGRVTISEVEWTRFPE